MTRKCRLCLVNKTKQQLFAISHTHPHTPSPPPDALWCFSWQNQIIDRLRFCSSWWSPGSWFFYFLPTWWREPKQCQVFSWQLPSWLPLWFRWVDSWNSVVQRIFGIIQLSRFSPSQHVPLPFTSSFGSLRTLSRSFIFYPFLFGTIIWGIFISYSIFSVFVHTLSPSSCANHACLSGLLPTLFSWLDGPLSLAAKKRPRQLFNTLSHSPWRSPGDCSPLSCFSHPVVAWWPWQSMN